MFRYHQRQLVAVKRNKKSQNCARRHQLRNTCELLPGTSQRYGCEKGKSGLGFHSAHGEQRIWKQEDLGGFIDHSDYDISRWHEKHKGQSLEEIYPGSQTSMHDRTRWQTSKEKTRKRKQQRQDKVTVGLFL